MAETSKILQETIAGLEGEDGTESGGEDGGEGKGEGGGGEDEDEEDTCPSWGRFYILGMLVCVGGMSSVLASVLALYGYDVDVDEIEVRVFCVMNPLTPYQRQVEFQLFTSPSPSCLTPPLPPPPSPPPPQKPQK
jgi:hypothetical protein